MTHEINPSNESYTLKTTVQEASLGRLEGRDVRKKSEVGSLAHFFKKFREDQIHTGINGTFPVLTTLPFLRQIDELRARVVGNRLICFGGTCIKKEITSGVTGVFTFVRTGGETIGIKSLKPWIWSEEVQSGTSEAPLSTLENQCEGLKEAKIMRALNAFQETFTRDLAREGQFLEKLQGKVNIVQVYGVHLFVCPIEAKAKLTIQERELSQERQIELLGQRGCPMRADFIAMEAMPGEPMSHFLEAQCPFNLTLAFAKNAAKGLAQAHEAGIIHADVKSDNFMADGEGNVKLIDFGTAQMKDEQRAEAVTVGNFPAIPPEYINPEYKYSPSYDSWGLGVMLLEMFSHNSMEAKELLEKISSVKASISDDDEARGVFSVSTSSLEIAKLIPLGQCNSALSSLISGLLCPNPENRLTAKQAAATLESMERDYYSEAESQMTKVFAAIHPTVVD